MPIAKDLLVVMASVPPAVELEWNRWYNEVHLPDIAACPGFVSAQRYCSEADGQRQYLTLYELESSAALDSAEFAARRGWGPFKEQVTFKTARYSRIAALQGVGHAG
jgi:hypothetical protein